MKKANFLFVIIFAFSVFANVYAQDTKPTPKNRTLSNGFSMKIEYGFPSKNFGTSHPVDDDYKYGLTYGLQMGNQWYFSPSQKFGIGLNVNWFDFSFTAKSFDESALTRATIDASLLEIGPIGTYALNSEMAIDLYYNIRPTAIINIIEVKNSWDDYTDTWEGVGITHAIGSGFRWRALLVGMEYVFGSVNDVDDLSNTDEDYKVHANCFRVLIGVKF